MLSLFTKLVHLHCKFKFTTLVARQVFIYYGCLSEWALQRNISQDHHGQSDEELDRNLRVFYAEVRNKSGENYGKSTLLGLRSGIERYLNYPQTTEASNFPKITVFMKSNMILDTKIKNLKQLGKQNIRHKPAITTTDLKKLIVHPVISPTTPLGLLRNVWSHTTLYWCRRWAVARALIGGGVYSYNSSSAWLVSFETNLISKEVSRAKPEYMNIHPPISVLATALCRRGREGQRNLTPSSFTFAVDENSRACATMIHDELSKSHPGGFDDTESFEKDGRMYRATDDLRDGYNALELYISRLNPQCPAFFQFPKRKWSPNDSV